MGIARVLRARASRGVLISVTFAFSFFNPQFYIRSKIRGVISRLIIIKALSHKAYLVLVTKRKIDSFLI